MQATLDLLASEGYRAVTTAAVAGRAGASTASLYRRWPTKQALVSDVARSLTLDALGEIDSGTLAGDLDQLITRKRGLFDQVGTALLSLLAESCHDTELRAILRTEVIEATDQHLKAMLRRAVLRGEIPEPRNGAIETLSLSIIGRELLMQALDPAPSYGDADAEVALILRALS